MLIPMLIAIVIVVAVIVLTTVATFRDDGDVERWAAISTIWIIIPIMAAGRSCSSSSSASSTGWRACLPSSPPIRDRH